MRIFVMRHGPAEANSETGTDADRALSTSGRAQTEAIAHELARRGEGVVKIFTSPLVRTRQTAAIVAAALGGSVEPVAHPDLAPGEDAIELVREQLAEGVPGFLLVGHAPDVSQLAFALGAGAMSAFEPAMIVAIDREGTQGRLRWVLRPSTLAP